MSFTQKSFENATVENAREILEYVKELKLHIIKLRDAEFVDSNQIDDIQFEVSSLLLMVLKLQKSMQNEMSKITNL